MPIEDVAGTVKELIAEGKVRTSACRRPASRRSAAPMPCSPSPRCRTNIRCGARAPETNGMLETCDELGIGFVPYSPLGRGS